MGEVKMEALVVKLVYTHASGACNSNVVGVRVSPKAQFKDLPNKKGGYKKSEEKYW